MNRSFLCCDPKSMSCKSINANSSSLRPESCSAQCVSHGPETHKHTQKTEAFARDVSSVDIFKPLILFWWCWCYTMVDMLTRVFMTFASRDQVREEFTGSSAIYSTLLVGERNTSRSLLLLTAVTAASQLGVRVVFFTQTHIQQLPAFLQKCIPILNPESLKVLNTFLSHILQILYSKMLFFSLYWTNKCICWCFIY